MREELPVAIIGGGPVGLAAAAHLVERKEDFILFESGSQVGTSFLQYGNVRLFSPWEYNINSAAKTLLEQQHIPLPDKNLLPLGKEIVTEYLQPLATLPEMKESIHYNSRVINISRKGFDKVRTNGRDNAPFVITVKENGSIQNYEARAVIDATGTWGNPNAIVNGTDEQKEAPITYGLPDILHEERHKYENKHVAVVGSGHSAINTLLDLAELKRSAPETNITWIIRKENITSALGGGTLDQLPARGELGIRLSTYLQKELINVYTETYISSYGENINKKISLNGTRQGQNIIIENIDEIIANTGAHPNFDFLRGIRYTFDPALESVVDLATLIDPNIHSCGTVRPHGEKELRQPEKDFYIIGAKSYGRAPTFLMATGYEQARSVTAFLCGDVEAAKRVELKLPETGVCSVTPTSTTKFPIQIENNCCSK
ncbi:NAD(P)-binding domain-containing protein [Cytobacillus kochii]|uniref:NAD(P)-binding domain-containing protein n=1 Tax=Cytobacillus kochii TaxID=859143 RepID=UPI0025A17EC8|nr:NAD(P)-binding domain-containing protein [Cytobacillus kochii]MDM5205393.1 NAD(P)-binding domain-containing protein [Cytobacillus kochii]